MPIMPYNSFILIPWNEFRNLTISILDLALDITASSMSSGSSGIDSVGKAADSEIVAGRVFNNSNNFDFVLITAPVYDDDIYGRL
jgi:hypothetical protein